LQPITPDYDCKIFNFHCRYVGIFAISSIFLISILAAIIIIVQRIIQFIISKKFENNKNNENQSYEETLDSEVNSLINQKN
jgi:hypothetical protein